MVSIGGTSVIGEPESSETFASGRSKRSSAGEPNYSTKRQKIVGATSTIPEAPGVSLGAASAVKKGRGRPPKDDSARVETTKPAGTRGRPKKAPGSSPGRPKKTSGTKFSRVKTHKPTPTLRQALKKAHMVASAQTTPRKSGAKITANAKAGPTFKKAGRPKGAKNKSKVTGTTLDERAPADDPDGLTANQSDWDDADAEDDDKQYWLMKAEPDSRIEKGVDVKFSIDDLMNATEPERWDGGLATNKTFLVTDGFSGVRNPMARNNMRAMKKGDLAFFYHSSCKKPGVAGIMEIVEEHSIDGNDIQRVTVIV